MALAEFAVDSDPGGKVIVDVDVQSADGIVRVSRGADGLVKATQSFEAALGRIRSVVSGVLATVKEMAPTEAEVEMGFKLSAEAGAVLTKAGGEAHLKVKLVWKKLGSD